MVFQPVALMQRPEGETNASARTSGLFADRSPAAAALSPRNPLGAMAAAGARRMGFVASHGADGDLAAARAAAIARPAELELARIRHAGRLLAAQENARAPAHLAARHAECKMVRDLPAGDRGWYGQWMGPQRPQLRPSPHAQARRPAGNDQQVDGHHREVLGPASARMVRTRIDADVRHA